MIKLKGATLHNLKNIDIELPPNRLILFTGVSGSGKSSMAFDTLYAEGQRRYVESLSAQVRRQMGELRRPPLEESSGITPTIAIEQKSCSHNPRSTVGTLTQIYDFLRLLYARVGTPYCPISCQPVSPQSSEQIIASIETRLHDKKIMLLAPFARQKKGAFKEEVKDLLRKGFLRARIDGKLQTLDEQISLDPAQPHNIEVVIDRIKVGEKNNKRLAEGVISALELGDHSCIAIDIESEEEVFYSTHAFSLASGIYYPPLEPQDFSFNSPTGMCEECNGMGVVMQFNLSSVVDPKKSIREGCCSVASSADTVRYGNIYENLAKIYGFDLDTPFEQLSQQAQQIFLYGTEKKWTRMLFTHPVTKAQWVDNIRWRGALGEAMERYRESTSALYKQKYEALMSQQQCHSCKGSRLKSYPSACRLGGITIAELTSMPVTAVLQHLQELALTKEQELIAKEPLKEICQRLTFLKQVGLDYLALERTAPTLSGGESQRVRLAAQIGSGLVGITYILDEPSIGLHPRDNSKLIATLRSLRDRGNNVIVVEHDEETILAADHVVEFGPGAGHRGGQLLFNGSLTDMLKDEQLPTSQYLLGKKAIKIPKNRRKPTKAALRLTGACHHNLKQIDVTIPLGLFVAITGVSGSGKSSLITDTLYPALCNAIQGGKLPVGKHTALIGYEQIDKVIAVDQSPIGRNPRSTPATYIKLFDPIRDLFTQLPQSQARGFTKGHFSYNVKEGSCPRCEGMGMLKVDMEFLEEEWMDCPSCGGARYDNATLSVLYKGKSINDVLELEVDEAVEFFGNIPSIAQKLKLLQEVGMGYIKLGQSSTTLSGGEAQRIKLAKELGRPARGHLLYLLDEPTTGLHLADVDKLLNVLHRLIDKGHTLVAIEHNMELVKTADWVIDLGPEGGGLGGQLMAVGTPEKVAKSDTPTAEALKQALSSAWQKKAKRLSKLPASSIENGSILKPPLLIEIEGAEQNNLKDVDLELPRNKISVLTGPSGAGKSSLAFETIYAEGQRRYSESLSPYARQFVKPMAKPKVKRIEGLSPTVAIEPKTHAGNPRSTVGTMTEIYDYLRLLFARMGTPHCPETGELIQSIDTEVVVKTIMAYPEGEKIQILAPLELKKGQELCDVASHFLQQGFMRMRIGESVIELDQTAALLDAYDPKRLQMIALVIDRLKVQEGIENRLWEAVKRASELGQGKLLVMRPSEDQLFNLSFAVASTGKSYPPITPQTFAFNHLNGMCSECQGLGFIYGADLLQDPAIASMAIEQLFAQLCSCSFWPMPEAMWNAFLEAEGLARDQPLNSFGPKQLQTVLYGSGEEVWYSCPKAPKLLFRWRGINEALASAARNGSIELREALAPLLKEHNCTSCKGGRLNPLASHVTVNGASIVEMCQWPVGTLADFFEDLEVDYKSSAMQHVQQQLLHRLRFLCRAGLHYLSLGRSAPSLSGGETQRIRLAKQLGSGLSGILYILDEPTRGLHARDCERLQEALQALKQLNNTLILVEHNPKAIAEADYIADFGPRGGDEGGRVTATGSYKQILKNKDSLTGRYLSGKLSVDVPRHHRRKECGVIEVKGACLHNLKNIDVALPLGRLVCLTGVSGSGKSTLMQQILYPALRRAISCSNGHVEEAGAVISGFKGLERVINVDQQPVGLTRRSYVASYCELLDPMRLFFTQLPDARVLGLEPKHFSPNHRKGMCTHCWGLGYRKVEMHFLPPVEVLCEQCQGMRLNAKSLSVKYQGKNLGQWLMCSVDEVCQAFEVQRRIRRIAETLIELGLGYLKLGQGMATLSGGEAQRIKLARELSRHGGGKTIYLLDEPTSGLHSDDIAKLLKLLHKVVDKGHSLIVIEHNLDMIRSADWVIELGPEAGDEGGQLLFSGRPEELKGRQDCWTGRFL